MSSSSDVTQCLRQLTAGNREVVQRLWEGYFSRLVGLARKRLGASPRRVIDEEDVALSVFDSFCRRAEQGGFAKLDDRDDLWQVLTVLTVRKVADVVLHERALKRGGGEVRGESAFADLEDPDTAGIEQIASRELSPEQGALLDEAYKSLLDRLGDETMIRVAVWKLEGATNMEIKSKLGCSIAGVERMLKLIRETWNAGKIDP